MGRSYSEEKAKFKYDKAIPLDDLPIIGKKKKTRQHKKSDHKHNYVPVICYDPYGKFTKVTYGFVCDICGRVDDMHFCWGYYLDKIKEFEEKYPDFKEITLPEDWNWITDKYVPFGE